MDKKYLKVCCSIIEKDGKILAAQRSEKMKLPLKWEFPGGKVEAGESPEAAIRREIKEELGVEIVVKKVLPANIHDYGNMIVELIPFVCSITSGKIEIREHRSILWDVPSNMKSLDWADADFPIFNHYLTHN